MKARPTVAIRTRGGAALPVVLTVAGLLLLLAGLVHGHLLTSQRLAANQHHAAIAAEAADAGIDWMLGRLNAGTPVDARCRPEAGSTTPPFRDTFAGLPDEHGAWSPPSAPAACAIHDTWDCRCPAAAPSAPAPRDVPPRAAFSVQLLDGAPPDVMKLTATGCSGWALACGGPPAVDADARARVSVSVAHLPALAHAPAAALTVHGRLDLGDAPWRLAAGPMPGALA
ncbi:MAG: hypothetical protein ABW067_01195, partial [Rhizobacter sp.]